MCRDISGIKCGGNYSGIKINMLLGEFLQEQIAKIMLEDKKMETIVYRKAQEQDAEKIVEFFNMIGGETSFMSFEKDEYPLSAKEQAELIRSFEGDKTNTMLLAMDGDEIAGLSTITSSHKIKSRHIAELGIVVAKKYHGNGIGTSLIHQVTDWVKGNGITTKMRLDVRADNLKAVQMYLKMGFVVEGHIKHSTLLNGIYYDDYVMGKML